MRSHHRIQNLHFQVPRPVAVTMTFPGPMAAAPVLLAAISAICHQLAVTIRLTIFAAYRWAAAVAMILCPNAPAIPI